MPFQTFELISTQEANLVNLTFTASNPPKVLIVLSKNEDKDLRDSLLPKIMQAVKIDTQKEAIVFESPGHSVDILKQVKALCVPNVISFGVSPKDLALNFRSEPYHIINTSSTKFLFSDSLSVIANNQERKKALWLSLQDLFLNNT